MRKVTANGVCHLAGSSLSAGLSSVPVPAWGSSVPVITLALLFLEQESCCFVTDVKRCCP